MTKGNLAPGKIDFFTGFRKKAGRQYGNIRMGFHIGNHTAQQGRMKGNSGIHDQMVFTLQPRDHSVVRTGEADVFFLREDDQSGKGPFEPFRRHLLRRIVAEKDGYLQIRILNAAKGKVYFITAVIYHQTGGQDRRHGSTPP